MAKADCTSRRLDSKPFGKIQRELSLISDHLKPAEISAVEDVCRWFEFSQREDAVVRFRDNGFPRVVVAWRWLGSEVGAAYMSVDRRLAQVHLMLSGADPKGDANAQQWLKRSGIDGPIEQHSPGILSLERVGISDDGGGYLLGLLLFAPFCEVCGL